MEMNRRDVLGGLGGLVVGGAVAGLLGTQANAAETKPAMDGKRFMQAGGDFGWKPHKLDPKECADVAYDAYWHKGYACGYGVFYGIVGMMGEKYGAPYNTFPFTMFEFLKGGISDWGTICGALGGAAAAYALFYPRKERNAMVNELFRWYEQTKLPIYNPGDKAQDVKGDIPGNMSEAVLCHISVSKWCFANKEEATSKKRSERCGRLTADVCAKAVEILNAKIVAGKDYKPMLAKPETVTYCGECHQTKGKDTNWGKGVLNCKPCHSGTEHVANKYKDHP